MIDLQVPITGGPTMVTGVPHPKPYRPDEEPRPQPFNPRQPWTWDELGHANWMWDDELECHIPCCSRWMTRSIPSEPYIDVLAGEPVPVTQFTRKRVRLCGNGPLTGEQILTGNCGESHDLPPDD